MRQKWRKDEAFVPDGRKEEQKKKQNRPLGVWVQNRWQLPSVSQAFLQLHILISLCHTVLSCQYFFMGLKPAFCHLSCEMVQKPVNRLLCTQWTSGGRRVTHSVCCSPTVERLKSIQQNRNFHTKLLSYLADQDHEVYTGVSKHRNGIFNN